MDLDWLPRSLRDTLREILEIANGHPFRGYYRWLGAIVKQCLRASSSECVCVIELGAGSAPVTRRLVREDLPREVCFAVTDIQPDVEGYEALGRAYPDRVFPELEPVDFSAEQDWPADSMLVLSTTFHHVHPDQRLEVLENLVDSGAQVIIFEALNRNLASMVLSFFGGLSVALVAPFFLLSRPGRLRRFFWCWLLPFAPLIFSLDGVTSAWRCWTKREWLSALESVAARLERPPELKQTLFCLALILKGKTPSGVPMPHAVEEGVLLQQ